jgi:ribose transport system ATP-binding protein
MADTAILKVEGVALTAAVPPFDELIAPGDVVGLAGLDGHGQDLFLECLAGLHPPVAGRVVMGDRPVTSFRNAAANGIAYLPRDRRTMGIFPNMSVIDNFGIASMGKDLRAGFISMKSRRARYERLKEQLSIVAQSPDLPITGLSGGNQQKVLLARLLARDPKVLLLNDPTRGVDIATRRVLYRVFRELANEGLSLVVLSSEIEEAIGLCDRVLVFRDQHMSARLTGADKTADRVIAAMFGRAA